MNSPLILASSSSIRYKIIKDAGLDVSVSRVKVDESSVKESLLSERATARDIADTLAEMKAQKSSMKNPTSLVLGCDQVLEYKGQLFSKPKDQGDACAQLKQLSSGKHVLLSAAVLYENQEPIWRFVGKAEMYVRELSDDFIATYVSENWTDIQHCVGCYQIEGTGVQLFSRVQGDHFTIMGLPLYELLAYFRITGRMKV